MQDQRDQQDFKENERNITYEVYKDVVGISEDREVNKVDGYGKRYEDYA